MTTLPIANIFQPLIDVFDHVLVFFHNSVGLSWGFSIIALTVCVRAVLIPLTLKQFRSMQGLQRLAPEIKELQAKYKDDKQRLNQEMMKFYQEHKVNPLASCLPLALQLPFFISLFYMLRHDLLHDICPVVAATGAKHCGDVPAAGFLFIPDLTAPATGAVLVVLLILYIGTQLISSLITMVGADKTQRNIMLALPIVFATFVVTFPAGLVVYWITTNAWTIVQQWIVKRHIGPRVVADMDKRKADNAAAATAAGGTPAVAAVAPAGGGGGTVKAEPATNGSSGASPPPPPRRRKKRSGRRR
jgi:YidC/Oxa1 family membrane protein insertase